MWGFSQNILGLGPSSLFTQTLSQGQQGGQRKHGLDSHLVYSPPSSTILDLQYFHRTSNNYNLNRTKPEYSSFCTIPDSFTNLILVSLSL